MEIPITKYISLKIVVIIGAIMWSSCPYVLLIKYVSFLDYQAVHFLSNLVEKTKSVYFVHPISWNIDAPLKIISNNIEVLRME